MLKTQVIGVIGLGAMGGPMAKNLIKAGYQVHIYDIDPQKVQAIPDGKVAENIESLVADSDIVMTSVPSFEVAVEVGRGLLAYAREGQTFIELSTITPSQAIELAEAYAERGATRLDVPVSGGAYGSERGILRMFVGGEQNTAKQCWPIFEVLGDPDHIVYCGPAGSGQIVKIVNQMSMGLKNAIFLETIGYGVKMGVDVDVLVQGIGGDDPWRQEFERMAAHIKNDDPTHTDVKYVQLQQFSDEAAKSGYQMPLTRALFDFCKDGEHVTREEIYSAPSFWHELMKKHSSE